MKIVFVSNFMNHHQLPFSKAMIGMPEIEYKFIATEPVPDERLKLGYHDMNREYDFVICAYENEQNQKEALSLCEAADVVIFGSAPMVFVKKRLKQKKLTFRYSERIYKKEPPFYQMPLRALKYFWTNGRHKSLYLLCASAYAAADYARTFTFLNKTYKWGYFPEIKKYESIEEIIKSKTPNSILWAGRLIDWKHPEIAVYVAKKLKEDGYDFSLNIIGSGEMKSKLEVLIHENELLDCVHLLGAMSPERVREYMEKSQIYLFTSDRQEGWGVVLNESMNSGCAAVVNSQIGSVPLLIEDKKNGFIYEGGNFDDLYTKVRLLMDDPCIRHKCGVAAYKSLTKEWEPRNAAERFVELAKALSANGEKADVFKNGICSKAYILKDDWYKTKV